MEVFGAALLHQTLAGVSLHWLGRLALRCLAWHRESYIAMRSIEYLINVLTLWPLFKPLLEVTEIRLERRLDFHPCLARSLLS